jgi:hypothetical protein
MTRAAMAGESPKPEAPQAEVSDPNVLFRASYVGACRAGARLMAFMNSLGCADGDPLPALAALAELTAEIAKIEASFTEFARLTAASGPAQTVN